MCFKTAIPQSTLYCFDNKVQSNNKCLSNHIVDFLKEKNQAKVQIVNMFLIAFDYRLLINSYKSFSPYFLMYDF